MTKCNLEVISSVLDQKVLLDFGNYNEIYMNMTQSTKTHWLATKFGINSTISFFVALCENNQSKIKKTELD